MPVPEGSSHPRTTHQVCPMATCTEGREAPATTSARSNTAGPLAPAARSESPGAATGTEDRDPGAAPRREGCRGTRARFQVGGGTQSCGGRRRHSSQPQRGVEESPPTSSASVCSGHGCTMREFLGSGQEEGGSRQRVVVVQAQTELTRLSAEVVEGEQRLATLRAELERSQSPAVTVDLSAEVQRLRALVEQLSKEKEDVRLQTNPKPQAGVSSGRFRPTVRRGDARVDSRPTEGSASGHRGRPSLRSGEGSPNSCLQQHRSGSGSSKNNLQRCHLQWRTW